MGDNHWYQDAIFYQLHVRAFYDSNGDGTGDFPGLVQKLDYLQNLGVTALWLLPFYPSPLRDDGYDIADFHGVHPAYGTLNDFRRFLDEAHRRSLRVAVEMVLNHTSDQHSWFQAARRAPAGSPERRFYIWSDTPDRLGDCRVVVRDAESSWAWDPVAGAYYWHRFYSHEPDLNYDNPAVQEAALEVVDFWLDLGVDALGLAAAPSLFDRDGAACEDLPETHAFLRQLRRHVDERYPDGSRVLIAEANEWPEDAAAYLGQGDECQMAVNFPIAPRLFMAVRMEDRFPVVDILKQTPPAPGACQWVVFLRNHDELTLDMVTDEERDYMYRVYARDPQARVHRGIRRRLAPLTGNHRAQIELLNSLLFSLPGSPALYYGDEIGMGDNIYLGERNGVRTPMQWSADRNAGFSRANPQRLYLPPISTAEYHYEAVNVQTQQANPNSLLWWTRRLIALRRRFAALARGTLEFLPSDNRKVLAYLRRPSSEEAGTGAAEGETILVVANLSRFAEYVELDLSEYRGQAPTEVVGQRAFAEIGEDGRYPVMLAPFGFYWLALREPNAAESAGSAAAGTGSQAQEMPLLRMNVSWDEFVHEGARARLEEVLPGYFRPRRWFRGKARSIRGVEILDAIGVPFTVPEPVSAPARPSAEGPGRGTETLAYVLPVRVDYTEGDSEIYVLALAYEGPERAAQLLQRAPQAGIARMLAAGSSEPSGPGGAGQAGLLYDALWEPAFASALVRAIAGHSRFDGPAGSLLAEPTSAFGRVRGQGALAPRLGRVEQSNTSIALGDRLILKVFRRIEEGINPDLEVTRFLTERTSFKHSPPVAGSLTYLPAVPIAVEPGAPGDTSAGRPDPMTLGILQGFVPNEGDAWAYTLDALGRYADRVQAQAERAPEAPIATRALLDVAGGDVPELARELLGEYLASAALLGRRTAELHLALASNDSEPDFAPEPFTRPYQRSLYQSMRTLAADVFDLMGHRMGTLPAGVQADARRLVDMQAEVLRRFGSLIGPRIAAMRIRTHGDYHLGQVLYTGDDFVIIDFEGEPGHPLSERRFKRDALRDVAGMLRSFAYAAYGKLLVDGDREPPPGLDAWARYWQSWASAAFLAKYLDVAAPARFLPHDREELAVLLDAHLLEKAVYELAYELNNRPDWVGIPLRSLLDLLSG